MEHGSAVLSPELLINTEEYVGVVLYTSEIYDALDNYKLALAKIRNSKEIGLKVMKSVKMLKETGQQGLHAIIIGKCDNRNLIESVEEFINQAEIELDEVREDEGGIVKFDPATLIFGKFDYMFGPTHS